MTLLDALREELALTGTKKARDRGECGACTVHVDGRRVLSCMTLAAMLPGKRVTTIEGLEQGAISTPCRRRSSRMMASSAAAAHRGRSYPPSP
jgi:xanthine dehydrogenase YagT iron-sulfur-binding subunit